MRLADFITGTVAKRRWMGLKNDAYILISALKDTPGCGWEAPSSSSHETGCRGQRGRTEYCLRNLLEYI